MIYITFNLFKLFIKKFYSYVAIIALSSMALLSSCSKTDEETPITPVTADATVSLNENTPTTPTTTLYVTRQQLTAALQVTAVSKTSTDMKRIYVYKKSTPTPGTYVTYNGSGFKKDGANHYYYDIPSDQKNNTVLNLNVELTSSNTAIVSDEYYFAFTDGTNFGGPTNTTGILLGPAKIFIVYGILKETTGLKLNNIQGTNSGAFDLVALTNKSASDAAPGKDMIDSDANTALWEKSFNAGTSGTLYAKLSLAFDYATATDLTIKEAYEAGNAIDTQTDVAAGDIFVAKLRGLDQYALIKVTFISTDTDGTGSGKNNEYMEFSVKK